MTGVETMTGDKLVPRALRSLPARPKAGGRRGKERAASLRAEQRLAAGGPQGSPDPYFVAHVNERRVEQRLSVWKKCQKNEGNRESTVQDEYSVSIDLVSQCLKRGCSKQTRKRK
jgi:hypothetical protein